MRNTLIENPMQYVMDFVGVRNQTDLIIAIEIFLAEMSLLPSYSENPFEAVERLETQKLISRSINKYLEIKPVCKERGETVLSSLYYFSFLNWFKLQQSRNMGHFMLKRFIKETAIYILEERYYARELESKVARSLFQQYLKLNGEFERRREFLLDYFQKGYRSNEPQITLHDKILGAMTLQHRELYHLEKERLENHREYDLYDKFYNVLERDYQNLISTSYCLANKG